MLDLTKFGSDLVLVASKEVKPPLVPVLMPPLVQLKLLLLLKLFQPGEVLVSVLKDLSTRPPLLKLLGKVLLQKLVLKKPYGDMDLHVHHVLVGKVLAQLLVVVGIPLLALMIGFLLMLETLNLLYLFKLNN